MNEHLEPVFHSLLPELEKGNIDYWVYGGISIASYVGRFIRHNPDVDVFIREKDFEKAKVIVTAFSLQYNFSFKSKPAKVSVNILNGEGVSITPVYQEGKKAVFQYPKNFGGDESYPLQMLERVERDISDYRFFTPPNAMIKEKFLKHLQSRPDKLRRKSVRIDAEAILSPEDFTILMHPAHDPE